MARKLVRRLEKRLDLTGEQFIPLYLLEDQANGKDIPLFQREIRPLETLKQVTLQIVKHTNIKASIWWTFKLRRLVRIGQHIGSGMNPDYTQTCDWGTCMSTDAGCTKNLADCTKSSECIGGNCAPLGACSCPAPLANSTQVSGCSTSCSVTGTCAKCTALMCVPTCVRSSCNLGTCGYNCTPPFVWNGVSCQLPAGGLILLKQVGVGL